MTNQPRRVDESQNARNIPPNGGKISPEVTETVGKTADGVIAAMNAKKPSIQGENWNPDNVVKAYNIMNNTSPELKTWFAHNGNVDDIAQQLFEKISPNSQYKRSRRRKDGKMYYVFRTNTKGGILQTKFIFSLDTNGQIGVEQSIKSPELEERFFQYHLQYEQNNVTVQNHNIPLPEILNDDTAVIKAFQDTYPSHENIQNLSIERQSNKTEILLLGEYEGEVKVFTIDRGDENFGEILLTEKPINNRIPLILPQEAYGDINFDADDFIFQVSKDIVQETVSNDTLVKKCIQEFVRNQYDIKMNNVQILREGNGDILLTSKDKEKSENHNIKIQVRASGLILDGYWGEVPIYARGKIQNNKFEKHVSG